MTLDTILTNAEACEAQYQRFLAALDRYEQTRVAREVEIRRLVAEASRQLDAIAEACR